MFTEEESDFGTLCRGGSITKVMSYLSTVDKDSLRKLLNQKSESIGNTPLHEAVMGRNPLVVNLVLETAKELGVSTVNTKSRTGDTALHIAVSLEAVDCVEVLLQNGADTSSIKNSKEKTALESAGQGKGNMLRIFWNHELFQAVKTDSSKVAEMLKRVALDKSGKETLNKCLMMATENDNFFNIGILVLEGADDLQTCLNAAIKQGKVKARAMLMMLVAVAANDVKFIQKLFGESVEVQKGYKLYFLDSGFMHVKQVIQAGMISTVIPLALSQRIENRSEVRDAFLLRTDVSRNEFTVNWSWLRLQRLEELWLKNISWVKSLNLAGNELEVLPSTLGSCIRNVVSLILEHNEIVAIPMSVFQLPSLKELRVCHNNLTLIPTVSEWPSLTLLDLSFNHLTSLPSNVYAPRLLTLNLAHNNLSDFPLCVLSFGALTSLNLSSNYDVNAIPQDIERLENLTSLKVDDIDNLQLPPQMKATDARYTNLKEFYHMKVALVGDAKAGKCTLVSSLKREKFHSRNSMVEISEWNYERESSGKLFNFSIWNFMGQKAIHTSHKCLFSNNTLYIVAFDLTMGEKALQCAKEWLDAIICCNRHPSGVILVGTHLDEIPFRKRSSVNEMMKKASDTFIRTYRQNNSVQLLSLVTVGLKNNVENLRYLKDEIYRLAALAKDESGRNLMGQGIPSSYHALAEEIRCLQREAIQNKRLPVVNTKELRSILENANLDHLLNYEKNVRHASAFLDSIGLLTHYNDCRHHLNHLYFLDPQWLDSFLFTLLHKCSPINRSGIVRFANISKVCKTKLQEQYFPQSLVILSIHHLVMPINNEFVLFPSKLPQRRPDNLKQQFSELLLYQHRTIPFVMDAAVPEGFWSQILRWTMKSFERLASIVFECDISMDEDKVLSTDEGATSVPGIAFVPFTRPDGREYAIWQHGIHYSDKEITFRLEALEHSRPGQLEKGDGVLILVSSSQLGIKFARSLVRMIVYVIKAWFPTLDSGHLITTGQSLPCHECIKHNRQSPYEFTVENILPELAANKVYTSCSYYPRADDNHSVKVSDVFVRMLASDTYHL